MFRVYLLAVLTLLSANGRAQLTAPAGQSTTASMVKLRALGYWCDTSNLEKTAANRQAIYAFQKIEHLKRTGKIDEPTKARLTVALVPACSDSVSLRHYEVDLNKQVLLLVDSTNTVRRILPVSTGSGKWFETEKNGGRYALTPRGKFKVFYKVTGWRKSELGELYYPMYVRGGVAIHGAPAVPPVPASHGCIRIPMFAARELFSSTPLGTSVIVYGENPKPRRE